MVSSPIDFAIKKIIKGSHLDNEELTYVHLSDLESLNADKLPSPLITTAVNTYKFDEDKVYATARISILFRKPLDITLCSDAKYIEHNQVQAYAQMYTKDIMNIARWLGGYYKLRENNRNVRLLDEVYWQDNGKKKHLIDIFYDGETDDEQIKDYLTKDTIVVQGIIYLEGPSESVCCRVFNPEKL